MGPLQASHRGPSPQRRNQELCKAFGRSMKMRQWPKGDTFREHVRELSEPHGHLTSISNKTLEGRKSWKHPQTTSFLKRRHSTHHGARAEGLYQHLSREHLQQLDEHAPIPQVLVEVGDAAGHASQVRVHPFCEGLLLNNFPLI